MSKKLVFLAFLAILFSVPAYAQFGKNNVRDTELDQFYKSDRFDVWHNFDPNDLVQMEYVRQVVENLEGARDWMSSSRIFNHNIEERIPVLFFKTHFELENSNLVGGFMPEGVGAFVEFERRRMVIKGDFTRPLGRAIGVHELFHEFQYDVENPGIFQRVTGSMSQPNGYYEGCAEFMAGLYDPHTRDDIRRREQRIFAANPKSLPTWEGLNNGRVDPYTMWSMIPEFLEDKFSGGVAFCTQPLKSKIRLGEFVYDLAKGKLDNPDINSEKFDQQARHYWGKERGFEVDRINRPNPYEENANFRGWTVTPYGHPYPILSPARSFDGTELAAFTIQSNGVALVKFKISEEIAYVTKQERERLKRRNILSRFRPQQKLVDNLTPQLPPVPWEYLIVQGFETWQFNGFDLDWWQDENWLVKIKEIRQDLDGSRKMLTRVNNSSNKYKPVNYQEQVKILEDNIKSLEKSLQDLYRTSDVNKIAFFAKINRDHALVIIDAMSGEILKKIELEFPGLRLDQAFSPSFSPDGKKIYFSAASNVTRNIYSIDLDNKEIKNLTNDNRFSTAPAVSPDGSKIVYVALAGDGDYQHLFMLNLFDGKKEQLTFGQFNDSSPSWSDDGSTLVYVSDEADHIWNLYTFDLATRTVSHWTEFIGGVETPLFARDSLDKVYYVVFRDDDQYRNSIYRNYEVFAAELKKPIHQYDVEDKGELFSFAFNPNRDLIKLELDSNQFLNPEKPPERWGCRGNSVSFGVSTYWGMFGQSLFGCRNILETKQHLGLFVTYGSFKIFDYSYVNQTKRTSWRWGAYNRQMPLFYQYYDVIKRRPRQEILSSTWMNETGFDLSVQHPLNKFNRLEFFSRLRHRSFNIFGYGVDEINESALELHPDVYTNDDVQMYRLLRASNGSNLGFGAAYVRDTVLYSPNTWGPWHGNAFRAQFEIAPPLGKEFMGYFSANIQARTYKRLSDGVLFAGRVDLMSSSRASGDFMLLCGPDKGRGCEYGSIAGNEVAYGSVEIRFPIFDALVGPGRMNFGGVRGFLFADAAIARFRNEIFPAKKFKLYGFGVQYIEPFMGMPLEGVCRMENGKCNPTFYVTMSW